VLWLFGNLNAFCFSFFFFLFLVGQFSQLGEIFKENDPKKIKMEDFVIIKDFLGHFLNKNNYINLI
jgi:hypothetical protein